MANRNQGIYFDNGATTPVDPRVVEVMSRYLGVDGDFGNAESPSLFGRAAKAAVALARQQVADAIGADPEEIVWTSGATEANNLAIKGAAEANGGRGRHIVTCSSEHKAVLVPCEYLSRNGFDVTYLRPAPDGIVDVEELEASIRPDTILVSIMHVNNEIGVVQNIDRIAGITRRRGVLFHVDAAHSAGKLPIDLQQTPADLLSLSAHKTYGPKGIGALFVRRRPQAHILPQIHGGGHQRGMRSGTLATHQIVGMGAAFALASVEWAQDEERILTLRERLRVAIEREGGVQVNGSLEARVAGNLNISIEGVRSRELIDRLPGLAVSSGSACTSASLAPSHVLRAIGRTDEEAMSSLRITIGRFNTAQESKTAAKLLVQAFRVIRGQVRG